MNKYNIIACYSSDGSDWRIVKTETTTLDKAIELAKQEYLTNKWDNVGVESAEAELATDVLWDAGTDEISNFYWD